MGKALVLINTNEMRKKAAHWVSIAPFGTRVEFREPKRTTEQNDRMWAMLTDVASQLDWHGVKLSTDDWKLIFMDALNREMRIVPNLEGTGFVNLGRSSSKLSVGEMSDLIELIFVFGAQRGIAFNEPQDKAA